LQSVNNGSANWACTRAACGGDIEQPKCRHPTADPHVTIDKSCQSCLCQVNSTTNDHQWTIRPKKNRPQGCRLVQITISLDIDAWFPEDLLHRISDNADCKFQHRCQRVAPTRTKYRLTSTALTDDSCQDLSDRFTKLFKDQFDQLNIGRKVQSDVIDLVEYNDNGLLLADDYDDDDDSLPANDAAAFGVPMVAAAMCAIMAAL
jgi:hypothetical protein